MLIVVSYTIITAVLGCDVGHMKRKCYDYICSAGCCYKFGITFFKNIMHVHARVVLHSCVYGDVHHVLMPGLHSKLPFPSLILYYHTGGLDT